MTLSKITIVSAIIASLMANPIMNIGGNQQTINNVGTSADFWGNPGFRGRLFGRRDSVNNEGVFNNIITSNPALKILSRPKVDKHTDSDASNSNTSGSATNSKRRRDSVNSNGIFNNGAGIGGVSKILNRPKVDDHTDSTAASSNTAGDSNNSLRRRDSVNNDGIFNNVASFDPITKILNRPKVDKHTDSTAASSNTAGDSNNSLRRRDSVNNDGIFNNVVSQASTIKLLNRPKVDKHVDSDAHHDNAAGSSSNTGTIARRSAPEGITQNWFSQANQFKVLNTPTVSKPVGATAAGNNEAGGIVNNRMRKRDSINNDGVFSNIFSNTGSSSILSRPKVDKHVDADAHSDNKAGSAVNNGQFARRQAQFITPGAQGQGGFGDAQFIGGGPAVVGGTFPVWGFGAPSVNSNSFLLN